MGVEVEIKEAGNGKDYPKAGDKLGMHVYTLLFPPITMTRESSSTRALWRMGEKNSTALAIVATCLRSQSDKAKLSKVKPSML